MNINMSPAAFVDKYLQHGKNSELNQLSALQTLAELLDDTSQRQVKTVAKTMKLLRK